MKRTVFASFAAMLILSTAVTAQAAHTHEYTRQDSKVYVCECGKEKTRYSLKGERVITLNCNGGSLSAERKKVIKAACSLVDKVNYFWGGKSSAIGWNSEWGKLKTVSAEGSKTTGTKRPLSESLPERTLTETFLLFIARAAGIMSLSQQTAALVLRQDRVVIKKHKTAGSISICLSLSV